MKTTGILNRAASAALAAAGLYAVSKVITPLHRTWGARPEELDRAFPGDELIVEPSTSSTRAIAIEASAAAVWRAVLAGWSTPSDDEPIAGAVLRPLTEPYRSRHSDAPYVVHAVQPGEWLVLRQFGPAGMMSTIAYVVESALEGSRLLLRTRVAAADDVVGRVSVPFETALLEPLYFLAERRAMRQIRLLAESQ